MGQYRLHDAADHALAALGTRLHRTAGLSLGAGTATLPHDGVEIAVFGAHLAAQPLNADLVARASLPHVLAAQPTTPPGAWLHSEPADGPGITQHGGWRGWLARDS